MIALPPLLAGATKATLTCAFPRVATTAVGALGTVAGVTLADGAEATLLPIALVAITVQVTAVPLVRPVTVMCDALPDWDCAPQVAVSPVIALPPLLAGATKATLTCALPRVATTAVGAPGTVAGVTLFEGAEGTLLPTELIATTVQLTGVPLGSPVTVIGDAFALAAWLPQLARNPVSATPPVLPGATNATVTWALPRVATTPVGASGTLAAILIENA